MDYNPKKVGAKSPKKVRSKKPTNSLGSLARSQLPKNWPKVFGVFFHPKRPRNWSPSISEWQPPRA